MSKCVCMYQRDTVWYSERICVPGVQYSDLLCLLGFFKQMTSKMQETLDDDGTSLRLTVFEQGGEDC